MMPFSFGGAPPFTAASVHVRELWPLLPHWEHVRDDMLKFFTEGSTRAVLLLSSVNAKKEKRRGRKEKRDF